MGFLTRFLHLMPHLLGFVLAIGMTAGLNTAFAAPATSEEAVTVAFLYNFLKYAEWPEGAVTTGELTICVTDSTPLGQELDAIAGRPAQNKSVRIKRIELSESPRECHLLFIPREEKPIRIREWLKKTENMPILVVGNISDFLDMGGMIVLTDDERLRFAVNLAPVRRVGLKLSSKMLAVALEVRGK